MTMSEESLIRQSHRYRLATVGATPVSGVEDCVTTAALATRTSEDLHPAVTDHRYVAPMGTTTTAHDIATALLDHLRVRVTYVPDRKLHALLYLAQGLTLAADDTPLFPEPIIATAVGVHVDYTSAELPGALDDTQFGIVVVTAGRYGGLSAMDLEALIRGQGPWAATETGDPIHPALVQGAFRRQDDLPEGTVNGIPRSARTGLHSPFGPHSPFPTKPDSPEEIAAFIADVRARM
jgi:uncharacterized phage-associated protein